MEPEDKELSLKGTPFLGIHFECCQVYARIYKNEKAQKYRGRCPKCLKVVEVRVDPRGGTKERFFRAY